MIQAVDTMSISTVIMMNGIAPGERRQRRGETGIWRRHSAAVVRRLPW